VPPNTELLLGPIFENLRPDLLDTLKFELATHTSIKAALIGHIKFRKETPNEDGEYDTIERCFRRSLVEVLVPDDATQLVVNAQLYMEERIADFVDCGSGWVMDDILAIDIHSTRCPPLNGGCEQLSVSSIKDLKKLQEHPLRSNESCFVRCVALYFTGKESAIDDFISNHIDWTGPQPFPPKSATQFEAKNEHLNLRVNILYSDGKHVYPLIKSTGRGKNTMNVLLYNFIIRGKMVRHYVVIQNLSKFLRRQYSGNAETTKFYKKSVRCANCLCHFASESRLQTHSKLCDQFKPQALQLPAPGDVTKFTRYYTKHKIPIVGFFDFEAANKPTQRDCQKCKGNVCTHKTVSPFTQEPIGYSMVFISRNGEVLYQNSHSGNDAQFQFVKNLLDVEERLLEWITQNNAMVMTDLEEKAFQESTICHICQKLLNGDKVRDHDHIYASYIGAAHNVCNLNRTEKKKIPIYCHNLQGYDSHFVIQALGCDQRAKIVRALPKNGEKFKSLRLNSFHFVDSMDFLQGSLASVVNDLPTNHKFDILDQSGLYEKEDVSRKTLLLRKGIFCYEWATSVEKLKTAKALPAKSKFYSSLTNVDITQTEYEHAQKVFNEFDCKTMLEYMELYCLLDVFLLAEAVFAFRDEIYAEMKLDCW
jgi:hypothetical protein